jgi:hypothetical protein
MVKKILTEDDDALLAELGVEIEAKKVVVKTPREERIIAGFEEIERFVEEKGRLPEHDEDNDIFERLYAVRLDSIRVSEECRAVLEGLDAKGLLNIDQHLPSEINDEELLAELGVGIDGDNDITNLKHVKSRAEIKTAEEIAKHTRCEDFNKFKPIFAKLQDELKSGARVSRRFKEDATIGQGEFFILGGQLTYVAEIGEEFKAPNGAWDARLRVIYDNGTESDLLLRSLQRALYKDSNGRRVSNPNAGPLFDSNEVDGDIESGTIYVLRSKSTHSDIKKNFEITHKIGVTGGDIKKRIVNAKDDPTFLMSDVEIVATYQLSNINRMKFEKLIHKFFESVRLDIEIIDRFGKPIIPREWFLVPLFIIDEVVEKIKEGTIINFRYNSKRGKVEKL